MCRGIKFRYSLTFGQHHNSSKLSHNTFEIINLWIVDFIVLLSLKSTYSPNRLRTFSFFAPSIAWFMIIIIIIILSYRLPNSIQDLINCMVLTFRIYIAYGLDTSSVRTISRSCIMFSFKVKPVVVSGYNN